MAETVSVVIPTLNEAQWLPHLLDSLIPVLSPLDIIVVDCDSEDGTAALAQRYESRFTGERSLRVMSAPRGVSAQRNAGAYEAKYETLLFLDADVVIPSPQAFASMTEEFVRRNLVLGQPRIVPLEKGAGATFLYFSMRSFQHVLLFIIRRPYFAGTCLMTTKTVFAKTGGFDTSKRLAEDIDFSLRAGRLGKSGILHVKVPASARRIIKYGFWRLYTDYVWAALSILFRGGIQQDKYFYPFGDFGSLRADGRHD